MNIYKLNRSMWKMYTVHKLKKGSAEELSPLSAQTQSVIIIIIIIIIILVMSSNLGGLNSEGDLCSVYKKVSHHQLQGSLRSDNVNDSKTSSKNRTLHFWNSFLMISIIFVWFAKSKSALVQLKLM